MDDSDVVGLALKLRSLVWSWRMENLMRLVVVFGWRDPIIQSSDWIRFDSGLGPGSCDVIAKDGAAERIEIALSTLAADDAAGRAAVHDAFNRASAALAGALGAPATEVAGSIPEIRWGGDETTLLLTDLGVMIRLRLVTNSWLAFHDETNDRQDRWT
ncbi:DUF6301 family protein [Nocardia gamkensis]|uniref:Uncharacterized protein n=1 Tax=Nocardia gamkensis TaxID=352869 RepID=A0A7X6L4S1_9NOCA|nr:DUF6301 family protein [Nocardia gamkensis]NKY27762.1 hypothetical protein [Nocardia gamkensis]NQE67400.1 hypothetical protein [Nocardia gamkensis]